MADDYSKPWKVGDKCMALFEEDGQYYPAMITRNVDAFTFQVKFADYDSFACVKESGLLRESDVVPIIRCDAKFGNNNTKVGVDVSGLQDVADKAVVEGVKIDSQQDGSHKDTSSEIAKSLQSSGTHDIKDSEIVDDSTADPSEDHERLMSNLAAEVEASGIRSVEKVEEESGPDEVEQVKRSEGGDELDHVNKPKGNDAVHHPSVSALDIPAAPVMPNEEKIDENMVFDQLLRSYYNAGYYAGYHKGIKHGKQQSSSAKD